MRRLRDLICRLVGHRWTWRDNGNPHVQECTRCHRCRCLVRSTRRTSRWIEDS